MDQEDIYSFRNKVFPLGAWKIYSHKDAILQSRCSCKQDPNNVDNDDTTQKKTHIEKLCDICTYIQLLPNLNGFPEMLFHRNLLKLEHKSGVWIEFNALDALKLVKRSSDPLRVAVADGWQNARADFPFIKRISKPYDWTYTTDYKGTLKHESSRAEESTAIDKNCLEAYGIENQVRFRVEKTDERIDLSKLREREEIIFYDDITLYEDELADHGVSKYSVKLRVMPSCLFILARLYLRIDDVLVRINDTRVYHAFRSNYLLREYTNREARISSLNVPLSIILDPNQLMARLPLINSCYEKLEIPEEKK